MLQQPRAPVHTTIEHPKAHAVHVTITAAAAPVPVAQLVCPRHAADPMQPRRTVPMPLRVAMRPAAAPAAVVTPPLQAIRFVEVIGAPTKVVAPPAAVVVAAAARAFVGKAADRRPGAAAAASAAAPLLLLLLLLVGRAGGQQLCKLAPHWQGSRRCCKVQDS